MALWQRVTRLMGRGFLAARTNGEALALRELLAEAQRARRDEDYSAALGALDRAGQIAELAGDVPGTTVVNLQRAEIYTLQGRWAEAENVLLQMRHTAQVEANRAQMAYTLSALGVLAMAQGDEDEARAYYEQAVSVARAAGNMGSEGRAQAYLADIYLSEQNASYAAHLLKEAIPKLNMSGDVDTLAHYVGRLGEAFIVSGQDIEGERLLHRALRLAERLHDRPARRRWASALAERDIAAQRYDDAHKHLTQVLETFGTEARSSSDHARALAQMSRVCLRVGDTAAAHDHAQQAVRLLPAEAPEALRALVTGALGLALRASGELSSAIPHLEQAAQLYGELNSADAFQIEVRRALAAVRARVSGTEAGEAAYTDAIRRAEQIDARLEGAQARLDLGLLHMRTRRMHAAVEAWRAALTVYEAERSYAYTARVRCDIASAWRFLGQHQRAMKEYEQALMDLNSADDWVTRGLVLANAAPAYADQGDLESAEAFFNEAITIAVRTGDRAAEAVRRGNYGWFRCSIGRPREAVAILEHALSISREQRLDLAAAVQTDNLGLAHDALENRSAALTYHEQALEMVRELDDPHWEAVIRTNLGVSLLRHERLDEAAALFDAALAQGRADGDVEVIIRALTGQARVLLLRERSGEAGALLSEATALARRAGMRRLLADALHTHSEQQAAVDNGEQSRALWDEARRLFAMLEAPLARLQPSWLDTPSGES